ncbi:hypothetical protein [Gemmatimonas sp.]
MRNTVVVATLLLMPASAAAQSGPPVADFVSVREQFIGGQTRLAAQLLLQSTLYIRHQVGRSNDEVVGMQLLAAESQLEKLANAVGNGRPTSVRALEQALMQVDRLLALHYVQSASAMLVRPRDGDLPVIANDMQRGALHFERSFTLDGRAPPSDASVVLADVRSVATAVERSHRIPENAKAVLAAFKQQLTGSAVLAVSLR